MLANFQNIVCGVIGYIGTVLGAVGSGLTETAKKIIGL